jgi:hypothetical protein
MGSRRPPLKAIAAALAAVVVIGGSVALALVATGEDGSADGATSPEVVFGGPTSDSPPPTQPTTPAEEPEPAQPAPDPEQQDGQPQPDPADDASGEGRTTTFPRERPQAEPDDAVQRRFAVPPTQRFSGTGNARLGNVNIKQTAVVKWSTNGHFELRFGREAFPIIAPTDKGQLVVPAYNFTEVRVIARGPWKITISPQR